METLDKACTRWGMTINGAKMKTMRIGVNEGDDQPAINLKGDTLEDVEAFSYLGSEVGKTAGVDGEVGTPLCWIDIVNRDLANIDNWKQLVKDRSQWHRAIRQLCSPPNPT